MQDVDTCPRPLSAAGAAHTPSRAVCPSPQGTNEDTTRLLRPFPGRRGHVFGHEFKKDTDSVPFQKREGPWSSGLVTLEGDVAACGGGMNPLGCERGV